MIHEGKRIFFSVKLNETQRNQDAIGYEFDVLTHRSAVHTDEITTQRIGEKFFLYVHRTGYDLQNSCW